MKKAILTPAHAPSGLVQCTQRLGRQDLAGWVSLAAAVAFTPQALHNTHKQQFTSNTGQVHLSYTYSHCHSSYTTGTAQHTQTAVHLQEIHSFQ